MRKIIQIATATLAPGTNDGHRKAEEEFVVTALCDDGTVWSIQPDRIDGGWEQLPVMPQDR